MMSDAQSPDDALAELWESVKTGRVVPVVGAGVSKSTAGIPDWKGIIRNALEHVRAVGTHTEDEIRVAQDLLDCADLVAAAHHTMQLLGAPRGEYPAWLTKTFGVSRDRVQSPRLIHQIINLLSPILVTTNLDKLLSRLHYDGFEAVTWRQHNALPSVLNEGRKVLHVHGVYDDPDSVILGVDDYETLVADEAYRAVLQALWLEHTLLFIGCSFDGLEDPDLSRLLTWASTTFAGTPYKHYALMRSGTFAAADVRRFLHDWRIQIVGYGPQFEDLPAWLEAHNPRTDQARALRITRAKELQDTGEPANVPAAVNALEGLAIADAPGNIQIEDEVRRLFEQRQILIKQRRAQLVTLQRLTRTMVDPEAVRRELHRWGEEDLRYVEQWKDGLLQGLRALPKSFTETVFAAAGALFLFPDDLLAALKHRGVNIHERVLDGYCKQMIAFLKQGLTIGNYEAENMMRILSSLQSVIEADPDVIFALPQQGTPLTAHGVMLVVARKDGIELRRVDAPRERVANIPLGSTLVLHDACVVSLYGESVVMAYNDDELFAWNPSRSPTPHAEFTVSEVYGINSAAHVQTPDGLRTIVTTTSGGIYHLLDLQLVNRSRVPEPTKFVQEAVILPSGRVFALSSREQLFEVMPDGELVELMNAEKLHAVLGERPGIRLPEQPRLQHWSLRTVHLGGQTLLALLSTVRSTAENDTAVVFLVPDGMDLETCGHFYLKDRDLMDFVVIPGKDGLPRLIGTLLSDFKQTYDLVLWASGVQTTAGWVFVEEGSTGRTYDDMVYVIAIDPEHGFAGDDSGGLFAFSTLDGSFSEVDRDRTSGIRALAVSRW